MLSETYSQLLLQKMSKENGCKVLSHMTTNNTKEYDTFKKMVSNESCFFRTNGKSVIKVNKFYIKNKCPFKNVQM